jgi:serine/threonine protein kinase
VESAPPPPRTTEARARARLGSKLREKYTLDRLLGIGGMAAVYAATHRNSKRFAVKILHADLSLYDDLRNRFLREGYVANSVGHPGAVSVVDDDVSEDGSAFLVMELLDGDTVEAMQRRRGGTLSIGTTLGIVDGLLDVLVAAHARSIVHRDIKPANLFVTIEGGVKVLDFGVARLRDATGAQDSHAGLALGTPTFMPPEQALGRADAIDARTDLWAVGATMFTLLCGRPVHEAPTTQESMVLAATRKAPSIRTLRTDLSDGLVALVDKALAFDAADRWGTAEAMRDALRVEFAEVGTDALTSSQSRIGPPSPPSHPTIRVGGVVVAPAPELPAPAPEPSSFVATAPASRRPNGTRSATIIGSLIVAAAVTRVVFSGGTTRTSPAASPSPSPRRRRPSRARRSIRSRRRSRRRRRRATRASFDLRFARRPHRRGLPSSCGRPCPVS